MIITQLFGRAVWSPNRHLFCSDANGLCVRVCDLADELVKNCYKRSPNLFPTLFAGLLYLKVGKDHWTAVMVGIDTIFIMLECVCTCSSNFFANGRWFGACVIVVYR